ncbi:hypothetical protein J437_LFUL014820 [Ladona fulva]|uniref:Methuselah N-terminal domain-containing protein n=1 Tax=Ladona fulva TaxID=123851 RepID=A0A8K0KS57_LADFU|nr:hypothetical protein J437_LFUL014820 [Ladona fulva]
MGIKVVVLAALFFAAKTAATPEVCEVHHSIVLLSPRILSNGTLIDPIQGISYPPGTYVELNGDYRVCPCKIGSMPCLRKCCPLGMAFGPESKCIPKDDIFWVNVTVDDSRNTIAVDAKKHFALLPGRYCRSNQTYFLDPKSYFEDEFFIKSYDGKLTTPYHSSEEYGIDHFCIEYSEKTGDNRVLFCLPEDFHDQTESRRITSLVYPILMLISVPPLLVTFLVYALIPELRNLHGKCLMCYVLCLMFSYILLAISHLGLNTLPNSGCIATDFM